MVEHMMHSADAVPITEDELEPPPKPQRGLCLICGSWIDPDTDDDIYAVTLTRTDGDVSEHVAHRACVERVAHESARLPGAASGEEDVPADYLAQKPRTADGR